jgi:3-oxoadipate enol-lactonase
MLDAADAEGYAGCCEAIAVMDQRPDLAAVRAPTLVIAAPPTPSRRRPEAWRCRPGIPGASLTILADAADPRPAAP